MRPSDSPITAPAAVLGFSAAALLLVVSVAATGGVAQVLPDAAGDVPGVGEAPWGAWAAETVHEVGRDPTALALDSNGDPVIGYMGFIASGAPAGFLAEASGATGWDHGPVTGPAEFHDVTLDDQDRAHMVYENLTNWPTTFNSNVTYAVQQADGSWHREKVSDEEDSSTSHIALTSNGEPRITIGHPLTLRYLEPTANGWSSTKVAENGVWHDLALDSTDTPHLAFGRPDNTGGWLAYATQNPDGSWHVNKTVLKGCSGSISIDTGPNDRPHISCHLVDTGLQYVWQDAAGDWHNETADDGSGPPFDRAGGQVGFSTSIAVDDEGEPHIGYRYIPSFGASAVFPGKAHYASKVDGEWVVEVIDHDGEQNGLSTSLELDEGGRPHVSYVLQERYEDGFPGSGKLNTLFDVRYARPAQADALNAADAAAPDANAGAASGDGGAEDHVVVPPLVGQDAGVSHPDRVPSGVGGSVLMP